MEFCNEVRDESNPEEKRKHGKFTAKFSKNGFDERRSKSRSGSEDTHGIQKVLSKVHLPHMKKKTVQVKNDLHLTKNGSIQNIHLREDKDFPFH